MKNFERVRKSEMSRFKFSGFCLSGSALSVSVSLCIVGLIFSSRSMFTISGSAHSKWSSGFPSKSSNGFNPYGNDVKDSMAVCFVGMTRDFELTGPTLKKYLLGELGYPQAHVFLITPFDELSHKLSILNGVNLVSVRIFNDFNINESMYTSVEIYGNINGQQGLTQQFHMEERCIHDIEMRERKQGWMYKWVVRTRLDGFWSNYPPPLDGLNHSYIYMGSELADFGGVNDRFSIGNRHSTWVSISRLTLLNSLRMKSGTHAERIMKSLLRLSQLPYGRTDLHFCVFSRHMDLDMVSLNFSAPIGGYYCRPCIPSANARSLQPGTVFCDKEDDWMIGWEDVFDSMVTPEQSQIRKYVMERSMEECIRDWDQFKMNAIENANRTNPNVGLVWESPSSQVMCFRKLLKKKHRIGDLYFVTRLNYPTFYYNINNKSDVYSISVSRPFIWEWGICEQTKTRVNHIPSPMKFLVYNESNAAKFKKVEQIRKEGLWKWNPLNLPRLDILLIDVGVLLEDIVDFWEKSGQIEPTCQLLINFAYLNSTQSFQRIHNILSKFDFYMDTCLTTDEEVYGRCVFFSIKRCQM